MIDCKTPEPIKSLVYCCQSYLFWYDEYESEEYWTALQNQTNFLNRIRALVPQCLSLIGHDIECLDCE